MDHHPTSFFILENTQLGTFWVGQAKMILDENGYSLLPAVTQDNLIHKLETKYPEYESQNLDLVSINKNGTLPFYGVERWLSKLEYKLNKEPIKFEELKQLLTAGWHDHDFMNNSTLNVLHSRYKTDLKALHRRLVNEWESKGLRCLNTHTGKTRTEKYQESKKDPDFMYRRARKEVLRQMEKTKKLPKPETLAKYDIKDEEIKECMGPTGIIYKISSPSGKVYVGQTIQEFKHRIRSHHRKDSGCTAISRAIHKYGDEMKYEIIEDNIPHEQLDEREIYWVKELNSLAPNGYNLTTGGGQFYHITQEAKEHLRDTQQRLTIEKNGHLGTIQQSGNIFRPIINNNTTSISLSNGGFETREEAVEVLKKYTQDPENFTKVEGTVQRNVGSVYKNNTNKWAAAHRHNHLGVYDTQEEAEEVLKKYLEYPEKVPVVKKKYGGVCKDHNKGGKWMARYKSKFMGYYKTKEEGEEALERYVKDTENFVKPEKKVGCVYKKCDRWILQYKKRRLGSYNSKEDAEKARQTLQSSL